MGEVSSNSRMVKSELQRSEGISQQPRSVHKGQASLLDISTLYLLSLISSLVSLLSGATISARDFNPSLTILAISFCPAAISFCPSIRRMGDVGSFVSLSTYPSKSYFCHTSEITWINHLIDNISPCHVTQVVILIRLG